MEYAEPAPEDAPQVAQPPEAEGVGPEAVPMAVDDEQAAQQQLAQQQLAQQQHQQLTPEQLTPEQLQAAGLDPSLQGMVHMDPNALVGVPPGLAPLQPPPPAPESGGKFKPIDLDTLSPKSRQRVLRNRQAATRSKAKKKAQFQQMKDRKVQLQTEVEQLEAACLQAQARVQQLAAETKALEDSCKCGFCGALPQ